MGNRPESESQSYHGGYTGKLHSYKCRLCGAKFQHQGNRLPEKARICDDCYLGSEEAREQYHRAFIGDGA